MCFVYLCVCHPPQGSDDGNIFRLYDWELMDEFVYFSHSFVTIPPPGWTNRAHRSGVAVLGTVNPR